MKLVGKEGPKPLQSETNNFDNDLDKEWKEVLYGIKIEWHVLRFYTLLGNGKK